MSRCTQTSHTPRRNWRTRTSVFHFSSCLDDTHFLLKAGPFSVLYHVFIDVQSNGTNGTQEIRQSQCPAGRKTQLATEIIITLIRIPLRSLQIIANHWAIIAKLSCWRHGQPLWNCHPAGIKVSTLCCVDYYRQERRNEIGASQTVFHFLKEIVI